MQPQVRRRCLAWMAGAALWPAGNAWPQPRWTSLVPEARLRGQARMRFFGLTICDIDLWTGPDFDPDRYDVFALALELRYARRFEGAAIAQRSIDEMSRATPIAASQAQAWRALMRAAFPDVAPGDRLTGVRRPGQATQFFHNDQPTLAIADPAFAGPFFGIWLAPTTSDPAVRRALMGLAP